MTKFICKRAYNGSSYHSVFSGYFLLLLLPAAIWLLPGSGPAAAESQEETSDQLAVEDLLPDSVGALSGSFLIDAGNAEEFKQLIVPELYAAVSAGRLPLSAVKEPQRERPVAAGERGDRQEQNLQALTDPQGQANVHWDTHPLFAVGTESIEHGIAEQTGAKLLWNVEAAKWRSPFSEIKFRVRTIRDGALAAQFQATALKVYAGILDLPPSANQLFRELIRIDQGFPLDGFKWLVYRFLGNEEDFVWKYSPVLDKVRPLTGANMSDPLAISLLAPEDLRCWSGHPNWNTVSSAKRMKALVPTASIDPASLEELGNCRKVSPSSADWWNIDTGFFPGAAAWSPVGAKFVPRELLRLELLQKDPYSRSASETIYIDSKTWLPVYRFVYGNDGGLIKGIMCFASTDVEPTYVGMVLWSGSGDLADLVDIQSHRSCSSLPEDVPLSTFDPRELKKTAQDKHEPGAEETRIGPTAAPTLLDADG